jgi:hypothetical protein
MSLKLNTYLTATYTILPASTKAIFHFWNGSSTFRNTGAKEGQELFRSAYSDTKIGIE